jgi:hypothetical protein
MGRGAHRRYHGGARLPIVIVRQITGQHPFLTAPVMPELSDRHPAARASEPFMIAINVEFVAADAHRAKSSLSRQRPMLCTQMTPQSSG